jgi:vacuolar-type H+-ATPase subunit I/STV1
MKDCLLVGIVCLVIGFLLHDFVYPKDKVENMKVSSKDVIWLSIIGGVFIVVLLIIVALWKSKPLNKQSNKK